MVKYPSTPHLDFSPGLQNDDRRIVSMDGFWLNGEPAKVVVTEKLDGENTTMYRDHIHARSLDSRHHPSRDWVKSFWSTFSYRIPEGWRICGENVYAKHSIGYKNLKSYFYGFSIWNEANEALPWDETCMWFADLGIEPVPTLYRGSFSEAVLHDLAWRLDPLTQEGFVVRVTDKIPFADFDRKVAKWVRRGHVQTDQHWMTAAVVPNELA